MFERRQKNKLPEEDFILLTKPKKKVKVRVHSPDQLPAVVDTKVSLSKADTSGDIAVSRSKGVFAYFLELASENIILTVISHVTFGVGWFLLFSRFAPYIFRLTLEGDMSDNVLMSICTLVSVVGFLGLSTSILLMILKVFYKLFYGV